MRSQEDWNNLISGNFDIIESKEVTRKPYDYDPSPSNILEIYARPTY